MQWQDPEVGWENPSELKAQKLARSAARGLVDRDLKPDTEERRRISALLLYPPNRLDILTYSILFRISSCEDYLISRQGFNQHQSHQVPCMTLKVLEEHPHMLHTMQALSCLPQTSRVPRSRILLINSFLEELFGTRCLVCQLPSALCKQTSSNYLGWEAAGP